MLLKYFHAIPWEFSNDISCDYQVGQRAGLLFLSLKYHQLKPNYISERIRNLKSVYSLRILLCLVDLKDYEKLIFELTDISVSLNMTLMLCWSWEEAAKCIENYKCLEYKPSDFLKAKVDSEYYARAEDFLKGTHSINKTDIMILATKFKSLREIINANENELLSCRGLGSTKCVKLKSVFESKFRND